MSVVARPSALRTTPASQTCGAARPDFDDGVAGHLQAGIDAQDAQAGSERRQRRRFVHGNSVTSSGMGTRPSGALGPELLWTAPPLSGIGLPSHNHRFSSRLGPAGRETSALAAARQ